MHPFLPSDLHCTVSVCPETANVSLREMTNKPVTEWMEVKRNILLTSSLVSMRNTIEQQK
jgi:hypothetical protein